MQGFIIKICAHGQLLLKISLHNRRPQANRNEQETNRRKL